MRTLLTLLVSACLQQLPAFAGISGGNELSIDFTRQDASGKATWSRPEKLHISAEGLGWDGQATETITGWIQTKPLAVGLSWRPASVVSLRVIIGPASDPVALPNGQTHTPFPGTLYARFSPDLKHWSTWQSLGQPVPHEGKGRLFTGFMGVPQREREEFEKLLEQYSRLDVPWKSDEEAAVAWILSREPKFFERSLPFVGYVEFLFEAPIHGGRRITGLNAWVGYGINGLHSAPKDPKEGPQYRNTPWRLRAAE